MSKFYHTRKNTWLFNLPVLFIYCCFFTVQLTHNFDVSHRTLAISQSLTLKGKTTQFERIKQALARTPFKTKIRLNKRFQPVGIPSIVPFVTEAPVVYLVARKTTLYTASLYTSAPVHTNALRGPPVLS